MSVKYPIIPQLQFVTITEKNASDVVQALMFEDDLDQEIEILFELSKLVSEAEAKGEKCTVELNSFFRKLQLNRTLVEVAQQIGDDGRPL